MAQPKNLERNTFFLKSKRSNPLWVGEYNQPLGVSVGVTRHASAAIDEVDCLLVKF